ncbi:unnamed protein product [Linum tenue]|uniref:Uncharacterized protein n=1 Tax=Linum tenue TaxID=586396 RepID=A0AAV0NP14_9ROSI|nr:unnamed protein product [Linum tenue]
MLPRCRPTTLRACGVFARRSLPVLFSFSFSFSFPKHLCPHLTGKHNSLFFALMMSTFLLLFAF